MKTYNFENMIQECATIFEGEPKRAASLLAKSGAILFRSLDPEAFDEDDRLALMDINLAARLMEAASCPEEFAGELSKASNAGEASTPQEIAEALRRAALQLSSKVKKGNVAQAQEATADLIDLADLFELITPAA